MTFIPTVSRPDDPAERRLDGADRPRRVDRGARVRGTRAAAETHVAYLCGNPDMILSAEQTLLELGFPETAVKKELYWPKGKEPRGMAGMELASAIEAAEQNADE